MRWVDGKDEPSLCHHGSGRSPANHAAAKTNATNRSTCCPVTSKFGPSPLLLPLWCRLRRGFLYFGSALLFPLINAIVNLYRDYGSEKQTQCGNTLARHRRSRIFAEENPFLWN